MTRTAEERATKNAETVKALMAAQLDARGGLSAALYTDILTATDHMMDHLSAMAATDTKVDLLHASINRFIAYQAACIGALILRNRPGQRVQSDPTLFASFAGTVCAQIIMDLMQASQMQTGKGFDPIMALNICEREMIEAALRNFANRKEDRHD